MKLRLMICVAAASTALFAEDATSAKYAVMNVTNAYTDTVIAVPWLGLEGGNITISNLVNTTTLSVGDKLYFFAGQNGSGDDIWYQYEKKSADGYWEGAATITETGSHAADSQTVARGTGLILQRASDGGSVLLCGRVGTGSVQTAIAANGGKTLLANPTASAVNINDKILGNTVGTPGALDGDMILIPQNNGKSLQYTFDSTKAEWGCMQSGDPITMVFTNKTTGVITERTITPKPTWTKGGVIPVGTGAWYMSTTNNVPSGYTGFTVTW